MPAGVAGQPSGGDTSRQDPPKSSVTHAPPPATTHRCAVGHCTAFSAVSSPLCVGVAAADHVLPPSTLTSAAPVQPVDGLSTDPTAMHRVDATHDTEARGGAEGNESTAVQVRPSWVTATASEPLPPVVPTATQCVASKHATPYSAPTPATVVAAHVRPLSNVVSTVATSVPPTTTHLVALGQATP